MTKSTKLCFSTVTSEYKFGRNKTLSLIIYEIIAVERPQQYRFLWYVILLVFSRSKTIQFNVYFCDWVSEKKIDGLTRLPLDRKHCWSDPNVSFCYCKDSFLVHFFLFWSKNCSKIPFRESKDTQTDLTKFLIIFFISFFSFFYFIKHNMDRQYLYNSNLCFRIIFICYIYIY